MFKRIHSTVIKVSDQDAAKAFWLDTLGFESRIDQQMGPMRFLTVAPPGADTELVLGTSEMYGEGHGFTNGVSFIVDDVDAVFADLRAKGVEFVDEPDDMPWGARGASFTDPDGNQHFMSTD